MSPPSAVSMEVKHKHNSSDTGYEVLPIIPFGKRVIQKQTARIPVAAAKFELDVFFVSC